MTHGGWRRLQVGLLAVLVLGLSMISVARWSTDAAASAHGEVYPFGSAADHGSPRSINGSSSTR